MRTIVHAAFLAGLFSAGSVLPGAASAADLDYPYEPAPPPVAVVPAPPPVVAVLPPRCGFYRPCVRPWRFGFWRRPWRFAYAGPRPYAVAPPVEAYPRERFDRYGYGAPRPGFEGPRGYGPDGFRGHREGFNQREGYGSRDGFGRREGYGPREQYGEGRPYADPLGHRSERRRDERFDRYGDEGRGGRFDRAPGYEPGPGRGDRGEPG